MMPRVSVSSARAMAFAYALTLAMALPNLARAAVRDAEPALLALTEGAPVYFMARAGHAQELVRRLGTDGPWSSESAIGELQRRLRADLFHPQVLALTGIEVEGMLSISAFEPMPGRGALHHRLALPLAAPLRFSALLERVALEQEIPLHLVPQGSPLAAAGVYALYGGEDVIALLRLTDQLLIVDVATSSGGRLPSALELARLYPLRAKVPFTLSGPGRTQGARQLLPGAAVALYVNGRALSALAAWASSTGTRRAGWKPSAGSPAGEARDLPAAPGIQCRTAWGQAPAAFDDLALVFELHARGLGVQIGWGTSALGQGLLSLPVSDDAALEPGLLGADAAATLSSRLASFAPFHELRRGGPLQDLPTLRQGLEQCPLLGPALIAVRHWPQALGALFDPGSAGKEEGLKLLLEIARTQLRNLDVLVRGAEAGQVSYALAATFPGAAGPVLELSVTGAAPLELLERGRRRQVLYPFTWGGSGAGVAALEALSGERLLLMLAGSRRSLDWASAVVSGADALGGEVYAADRRVYAFNDGADRARRLLPDPSLAPILLRARLGGPRLRELATLPGMGTLLATVLDAISRLGLLEAELTVHRDLLLLGMRATSPRPLP
jgi:hypothetical protein